MLGWFDEHGPRAVMQITPDGDYTQTGVQWNKQGYGSPHHTQFVAGPERSGLYYLHAKTESGAFFSFPWVVAPAKPTAQIAVLASTNTWNAYNNFGGRSNYVNATDLPPRADRQRAAGSQPLHRDRLVPRMGVRRTRSTRRSRSSGPSRATSCRSRPRSPTDPRPPGHATWPRPSGGCWPGWSAKGSPTTSTATSSCTTARSISTPTRC